MATTPWRALGKCMLLMNAVKAKVPAAPPTKKLTGIMKPMPVSPIRKDFLGGTPEASRGEAVKKVWAYIKLHNLRNPSDKKQIICDQKLKKLFSDKETVGFMEVSVLLSKHFVKTG
ncbi:protein TRI1-like [Silene latifolia]|uniref:protein TRI1-like n=1 Tax=Silene latifolia TaxID=37657 RepID=UPI003D77C4D5